MKTYRFLPLSICLVSVLLTSACNPVSYDLKKFLEEQTGTITVKEAVPEAGQVALGTDGYVCLAAGRKAFFIALDNPIGYNLTVESSFTPTLGTEISGVTVSQESAKRLTVRVLAEAAVEAGNEGILHIKVKTAKEGRTLYEGGMGLAFMDFDSRLLSIVPADPIALNESFQPELPNYSISDAPESFTLSASAANPGALVTINGEPGEDGAWIIRPHDIISSLVIRVELPHGAAFRNYSLMVNREQSARLAVTNMPDRRVYQVQEAANRGLDTMGMIITLVSASGQSSAPIDPRLCTLDYDFCRPGTKTVTIGYSGLTTDFEAWVVGLSGLSVTGPEEYEPDLSFDPSSAALYNRDLGTVPTAVHRLNIRVESGLAGVEGAALRVANTVNNVPEEYAAENGVFSVPLATGNPLPPVNTIGIEVSLGDTSRTYTMTVQRAALEDETELFVSGPDLSPPGNDTTGDGSEEHPFATVSKALDLVRHSGLELIPDSSVTIIISGTITEPGTDNGMVEIAGGGYPGIILRGKGSGPEAGILDAGNANRVLYISNHNSGDYSTGNNKVTLEDNLTLTGGSHPSYGGGVLISDYYGYSDSITFTMNGGAIQGNTVTNDNTRSGLGGGVYVGGGTFTMNGGTIRGNTIADNGLGGGVYVVGGTFTMTGGTIQENTIANSGYGGGIIIESGATFTMTGGTIKKNEAIFGGGVHLWGGAFTMTGGIVQENTAFNQGGGVCIYTGAFTMNGGTIQGNIAVNGSGGGVYSGSTFTMSGGTIQGNTASYDGYSSGVGQGGGVFIAGGTFTKGGDALIYGDNDADHSPDSTENTAGSAYGHAVYVHVYPSFKKRDATAGPGINLYARTNGLVWFYNDTSPGGVGDTTANWE
jgi:hypothetical protein